MVSDKDKGTVSEPPEVSGDGGSGRAERQGAAKVGARMVAIRRITLLAVLVAVLVSLAVDCGWGTPSSFGIGRFFLLCPLGGLEAMLASGALIPVSLISMAVVLAFALVFGRAWCSWGCPVPPIRRFFRREPKPQVTTLEHQCPGVAEARTLVGSLRHVGRDTRTWVLVGVLVVTVVAGFPIFCLVCPIGLTFGTVGSFWHFFVDKQLTVSLLVFPAALVVELLVYRKWCVNLCPIGGLLGIFGQVAALFRPSVKASTCLRHAHGTECTVCQVVCPEHINLHALDAAYQLGECSRCGECVKRCPTASIRLSARPSKPVE